MFPKSKNKNISGKQKLGEFTASRLVLREIKVGFFQAERNTRQNCASVQMNKEKVINI